MPEPEWQRVRESVGNVRCLIIVAVLATLGFASPVYMQDEPPPDEVPVAEPMLDIDATIQVAVEGTVSAWLTSLPTPAPTATPTPTAIVPITLTGRGRLNTPPFRLDPGNYAVEWTAADMTNVGCFHGGDLRAVDGSLTGTLNFETVGSGVVEKGKTRTGATVLYNIKPNTYYLAMSSGCDWSVTITSQR